MSFAPTICALLGVAPIAGTDGQYLPVQDGRALTDLLDPDERPRYVVGFLFDGTNANVLYEVGLAHALRAPEQVLLFRSDADPLLFDVSGIRVHTYDPDGDPEGAKKKLTGGDAVGGAGQFVSACWTNAFISTRAGP